MLAYLGLGSNLGKRAENLVQAIELLGQAGMRIVKRSSVYETDPQDLLEQPSFLNMAVAVETELAPLPLLQAALHVEGAIGRVRLVKNGPRLIDVDVLLMGDLIINTGQLIVPHPRMWQRRFVLEPLLELADDLRDPRTGRPAREFLPGVLAQAVRRLNG